MKVLVIDSDPTATETAKTRLETAGYVVVTRNRSLGTAFAIADEKPDVLLINLNMPMLSGEVLAGLVKSHDHDARLRIIFHSDIPASQLAARAKQARVAGYVCKTGNDAEFIARFKEVLRDTGEA